MKLVVTAATPDAVAAAIRNGADEVLLSPRIRAEEISALFPYARSRGVALSLDFSRSCADQELARRAALLETLYPLGLDGVLAGDAGLLRMSRNAAPGCAVMWGGPCQNQDDLAFAAANGCAAAVLSPYLPSGVVLTLSKTSPLPVAVWALCPLCPGGDQNSCLLGKVRSPDTCGFLCRTLAFAGDETILKTRDFCLLGRLRELSQHQPRLTALVTSPDPSPEGVGFFARTARAAADGEYFDELALHRAYAALGLDTPTDAPYVSVGDIYYREGKAETHRLVPETEKYGGSSGYERKVPVRALAVAVAGEPLRLAVDDYRKHTLFVEGSVPVRDAANPTDGEELNAVWRDLPPPYICADAKTRIDPHLRVDLADAQKLRETAMDRLSEQRLSLLERPGGQYAPEQKLLPRADKPCLTVRVAKMSQVTPELMRLPPERLYIPLAEASGDPVRAEDMVRSETVPVAVFPRVVTEGERAEVSARLKMLHTIGFREALTYSPGQAVMALRHGFTPRADWNAASSQTLRHAKLMGVISCTLAPWLTLEQIRELNHLTDTEMIVYGRLPLLLARQCLIRKRSGVCSCDNMKNELSDGQGGLLPLMRESGHGTLVCDSHKLWMEPHRKQWRHIGLWAARLDFATENAKECVQIAAAFLGRGEFQEPNTTTVGFYAPAARKRRFFR
ncbi:MAG: hypothetical protein LBR72_00750 [Oscillospiraceae bacterium]|jgi:putative protease|nr:hypothetical protein [Oscillospiraceae bacterium]